MSELCKTFWGSHGCALERGHAGADRRHQCGLVEGEDGWCSVVERGEDGTWTVRYSTGPEPDSLDEQALPAVLFGADS